MANRAVLACVEDTCRRVTGIDEPFGNKIVLLAGDFRQTCPVVRRGTRAQVIDASIRCSPLWDLFAIRRLTVPIRNAQDSVFADWVDAIGDGMVDTADLTMLQHVFSEDDIINFVYPQHILDDAKSCLKRSILCPTNKQIDRYNAVIMSRVCGITRTYLSSDRIKEEDEAGMPECSGASLDYASRVNLPGLPSHSLTIKTNAVFRLMRNFSIARGLVKNVRVLVTEVGSRLITVRLIRDLASGVVVDPEDILIPRITFDTFMPATQRTLQRRQFPLAPAYATTFNSCQGLTLDTMAYTALSRVRRREDAVVRLPAGQTRTENVTYTEILL